MNWLAWLLIALFSVSALSNVAMVGRERKPTTPGQTVATLIVNAMVIVLIVVFWPRPR